MRSVLNGNANDAEARLDKSLVTANDTTGGYLEDKVIKGPGIIRSVENGGANEQLKFELGPHYKALASSGLYTGAVLSVGGVTIKIKEPKTNI